MMKGLIIQQPQPVVEENMSNLICASGEASTASSGNRADNGTVYPQHYFASPNQTQSLKKKRNLPGNPDPDAEVIALSPRALLATNRFMCEICNKGFQRDQNLQLHKRGHNLPWKLKQRTSKEVRKKVYVCPEASCVHHEPSRALGDLTGIKKHFCRKHGEKKWKCEKCSKRYAVQSDWKAHSKTCGTREYRCDCGTLFSRRDSFITHRAYCDALAEESARPITGTNNPISTSHIINHLHLQPHTQFSYHNHPFSSSMKQEEQNYTTLSPHVPSWLVGTAGPGPPPIDLASSIFSTRTFNQEFTQTITTPHENPNPNPSLGPTLPPYHPTTYPHMSATALLQKAAQMGATMSSQTCSSPPMIGPHQAHVSYNSGHNTTGFGFHLASLGNKAAVPAGLTEHLSPATAATGTGAPRFLQDMTRDFLGLTPLSHTEILSIAGLGNCINASHEYQTQTQTQKSWQERERD